MDWPLEIAILPEHKGDLPIDFPIAIAATSGPIAIGTFPTSSTPLAFSGAKPLVLLRARNFLYERGIYSIEG